MSCCNSSCMHQPYHDHAVHLQLVPRTTRSSACTGLDLSPCRDSSRRACPRVALLLATGSLSLSSSAVDRAPTLCCERRRCENAYAFTVEQSSVCSPLPTIITKLTRSRLSVCLSLILEIFSRISILCLLSISVCCPLSSFLLHLLSPIVQLLLFIFCSL
eukprot:SAG31_NODE_3806_length_3866_cov_1.907619_2_plen_160_part_00